jgi:transcriptional regulator with XRE-family HTH domain
MRDRGVRHRDLAEAIGLSRPQLTNILRGRFGTTPARVEALTRILEVWACAA